MERPIDEAVYRTALERIEELFPIVSDETPTYDRKAIELKIMFDIGIGYEEEHFPIGNRQQWKRFSKKSEKLTAKVRKDKFAKFAKDYITNYCLCALCETLAYIAVK